MMSNWYAEVQRLGGDALCVNAAMDKARDGKIPHLPGSLKPAGEMSCTRRGFEYDFGMCRVGRVASRRLEVGKVPWRQASV